MSRKGRRRGKAGGGCLRSVVLVLLAVVFGVFLWVFWPKRRPEPVKPVPTPTPAAEPTRTPAPERTRPLPADFESTGGRGVVALVLDDVGYEEGALASLAALDGPLTLSVLPSAPHAREAAALAKKKSWDLMVHLPMDSGDGKPERDSIGSKDADDVVRARLLSALDRVPGAIGLNNHQGSTATTDERVMRAVLGVVKEKNLFFLDSRTTSASVGRRAALAASVPFLERDVFLDDAAAEASAPGGAPEALEIAWKKALAVAAKKGHVIVIGHPHRATLEFLAKRLPELGRGAVHAVRVSELLD